MNQSLPEQTCSVTGSSRSESTWIIKDHRLLEKRLQKSSVGKDPLKIGIWVSSNQAILSQTTHDSRKEKKKKNSRKPDNIILFSLWLIESICSFCLIFPDLDLANHLKRSGRAGQV